MPNPGDEDRGLIQELGLGQITGRERGLAATPTDSMPPRPEPRYPAKLMEFCAQEGDYEIVKSQPLGEGRFSKVYLARELRTFAPIQSTEGISSITPPATPTSRNFSTIIQPFPPQLYAVKVPADRASNAVLRSEASMLSYLKSFRNANLHIVPFHGLDPRNNALVLSALPCSLENLITEVLASLPEATRTATVASLFPSLAQSLVSSLRWLHATGTIHADIKPPNILLQPRIPLSPGSSILSVPFTPLLSDFSSAFHISQCAPSTAPALGGGTYDFLAPELLTKPYPDSTFASDVWALAMTLLVLITGTSPYSNAGNRYMKLEWVKKGHPLAFVKADPPSSQRLKNVATSVETMDIITLLENGLKRNPEERRLGC
jgi:serine/threonine protein kinase